MFLSDFSNFAKKHQKRYKKGKYRKYRKTYKDTKLTFTMNHSINNENKETFGKNLYNFGKGILRKGLSPYTFFNCNEYMKNDREKLHKESEEIYNIGNIIGIGTLLPQAYLAINNPEYLAIPVISSLIVKGADSLHKHLKNKKIETLEARL